MINQKTTTTESTFRRPILAVDIDEVLAQFLYSCNKWHNDTFGTNFQVSDYNSYCFCETWNCTDAEALIRVFQFFDTHYFEEIPPVEGALPALKLLSKHFELAIVTSRQLLLQQRTRNWLTKHFPTIHFSHILFGNQWVVPDTTTKRISKKELCETIGAVALIDDLPKYILETAPILKLAVLFDNGNAQNWSKIPASTVNTPANIIKCTSWEQITSILIKFVSETVIMQPDDNTYSTINNNTPILFRENEADNDSTEDSMDLASRGLITNTTKAQTAESVPIVVTPIKI